MIALFYFCTLILVYIYFGYPLAVFSAACWLRRDVHKAPFEPRVTILISAYNEAEHIRDTIENKLQLDYPANKLEIIVVSDGSTDGTDEIVRSFADRCVRCIRQEPRQGKTAALNLAVPQAKGEIIVFSDANSIYDKDALHKLLQNFSDQSVGYVTGKMVYVNPDGSTIGDGCSAYMKYENLLRSYETLMGSIVGVDGGIDAVRKSLYSSMKADQLPDFILPLTMVEQGYRVIYEPSAILKEETLKKPEDEYRMRVRVSLRALWALWEKRILLNPKEYGIFSFQLLSHKVLRYLGGLFMVCLYMSSMLLVKGAWIYRIVFVFQSLFYVFALIAHRLEIQGRSSRILYITYYFTLINIAAAHALLKFIRGEKQVTWNPRKG